MEAIKLLRQVSPRKINQHDEKLRKKALDNLLTELKEENKPITILQQHQHLIAHHQGTLSLHYEYIDPVDVAIFLEELFNVIVRAGDQCTQLFFYQSKHFKKEKNGIIQASFSYYNTEEEILKLVQGLTEALYVFTRQQ